MQAPLTTRPLDATPFAIAAAAETLRAGGLVAFPTETVYGLGADAGNGEAVARLYAAKGRPAFNPLIVHVPDLAAAERLAVFDPVARDLAGAFWPGPLTLVLPLREGAPVSALATAGLSTVGLRVPAHAVAQALLRAAAVPVVAPSANRSGHVSPTTAAHVMEDLAGRIDLVVDGGATPVGVESTILAMDQGRARLLRPGGLAREAIACRVTLEETGEADASRPQSPGLLASHYATNARLRLDAQALVPGETGLDFGGQLQGAALDLSTTGNLVEAAANLFAALRRLDATGAGVIAVAPIPAGGLGDAIRDRLQRAAAPR